jgi:hypothetical protein
VVNPQTVTNTSSEQQSTAANLGSFAFGSLVGGIQLNVGGLLAFGQYQVTTGPTTRSSVAADGTVSSGHLLEGMTHSLMAGLRFSLGSSRESESTY